MKKAIFFLFVLAVAFYLSFNLSDANEVSIGTPMKDLTSMEILKQDFNKNESKVRIVTLLSPT